MKTCQRVLIVMVTLLSASCGREGIVGDVAVRYVKPAEVVSVSVDTTLQCTFEDVVSCYRPQVVNDTILVLQEQACDGNPYFFKAYSTNNFRFLGSFARIGRGPGEMMSPYLINDTTHPEYLTVKENGLGIVYAIDVEKSIESGRIHVAESYELPPDIIDWIPLTSSRQFDLQLENRALIFNVKDREGTVMKSINLFKGVDAERYMTHLSSIFVNNGGSGKVAEVMLMIPQINIIDTDTGQVQCIATDKDYRKWEKILASRFDSNIKEYYCGAASTAEYIFAVYKGVPLSKLNGKGQGSSLHVFDWDGSFLYDIRIAENIDNITYDSRTKNLYAVAKPDNRIVRYDLSGLL